MKYLKKLYKLIFMAVFIVIPFLKTSADSKINIPINVEWMYGEEKWANSPHKAKVVIEPQEDAPKPTVASFEYSGDYIIYFNKPNFDKVGRYEYVIRQDNEDFEENGRTVTFDKSRYRLIFIVENSNDGLKTNVFTYNEANFNKDNLENGKGAKIRFVNNDPHIHRNDGSIVDPGNPYHPFNPNNPVKPNDPDSPYQPSKENQPTDPTNPDRNENNTPIYPTEPEDPANPNIPINPIKPTNPNDDKWPPVYPPNPNNPPIPGDNSGKDSNTGGFPWWPNWPWNPNEQEDSPSSDESTDDTSDAEEKENKKPWWWDELNPGVEFNPENPPIDPTDPKNPNKPVDTSKPEVPWWWEILYPGKVFDPAHPDKPVEQAPAEKPWWWEKIFPDIPYNPEDPKKPIDDKNESEDYDKEDNQTETTPPTSEDGSESDTDDASKKSKRDGEVDSNAASVKSPATNNQSVVGNNGLFSWLSKGNDRKSTGRVKTGIESVFIWLIILLIAAYALYKMQKNKDTYKG